MSTDLVVQTHDPFQMMDAWDDEQFLAEMQGAVAKSLVYVFKQGGQDITGLSKVGVDECCMALVKRGEVIREEELTYTLRGEGEAEEALFSVKASRFSVAPTGEIRLDTVVGVKRQPLYNDTRNGKQFNPFWYETGAMKAARNARFRLIPSSIREGVIAAAKQGGHVRSNVQAHPVAEARPANVTEDGEVRVNPNGAGNPIASAPSEKQLAYFRSLMESPVFEEAERKEALDWLATKATRQTIKDQIDWAKRQVEQRKAAAV